MPDRPTPNDPLRRDARVREAVTLPVLGVPVCFEVGYPSLLEPVEAAFGVWRRLPDGPGLRQDRQVRVRVFREEPHPGDAGRADVRYRLPDPDTLLVGTAGSLAFADRRRDHAVVYASSSLVADADHFGYGVLSAVTLFLVTSRDRYPVHAAALVGPRGRGLLLHGPSGVGKSTLCVAAHRAGYRVLAEDVVYVQLDPTVRAWGAPGPAHVPPKSLAFFPGLAPSGRRVRAAGREKLVVPLAGPTVVPAPLESAPGVVLLEPSTGAPELRPAAPEDVTAAVARPSEPGFDLTVGVMDPVARALAGSGAWRLRVGSDPGQAIEALRALLE